MTTYALHPSRYTVAADLQKAVGQQYHLGLSATIGGTTYNYGYLLEPDNSKNGGFRQRTDTALKQSLIQYSSQNLIDRDIAYFPRVTDGDFSGGAFQEVFIDPKKFFDSDLDPRVPGFLQLRQQWTRINKGVVAAGPHFQVVAFNGDFWFTFGESSGNIYSASGGATSTPTGSAVQSIDTDGTYLYALANSQLYRSANGTTWTAVTSAMNGTPTQVWVVEQGTNGYFAYYQSGTNLLYKIDLTQAFPIAAGAQPQVPVGGNSFNIMDLCAFQTSIAILTADTDNHGSDVWYFDGVNLTRILRIEAYVGQGICNALGSLFVSAYAAGQVSSPVLAQIDAGSFTVVARPGSPFPAQAQTCLQPRVSSQFVFWPLIMPSLNGISNAKGVILQYDVLTGATSKFPVFGTDDFTLARGALRNIAIYGDSVAAVFTSAAVGLLQWQQTNFGSIKWQSSGWLVSSHIDFTTPGITKRFRRVEVHHAPLNTGESILVEAFVDQDPLGFTTVLPPVPAGATVTNNVPGTTVTAMTFGQDTVGRTLYFALQLTAGTANGTTPRVSYVAIEVGGTWVWELALACTSTRRLIDGQNEDTQGASGKDLAYLLLLSYEQGNLLTLYHRNGQAYTVTIESLDFWGMGISPRDPQDVRDEEYIAHIVLRQVA